MKVIYFERQRGNSFSYYNEMKSALAKNCTLYQYPHWSPVGGPNVNIREVLSRCPEKPDVICFGFGWTDCSENSPKMVAGLNECDVPVGIILNKEYAALDKKLEWIKEINPIAAFTVHHDYKVYQEKTGVSFYQLPFAVNTDVFKNYGVEYTNDFGFSGIIRPEQTDDWRTKIYQRSRDWKDIKFFFTSHRHDSLEQYAKRINATKIWLSTTGPADLVGTRYYEAMASKTTLLVCNRFDRVYDNILEEDKHCIMFGSLEELEDKIRHYLKHDSERMKIVNNAYELINKKHTWNHRGEFMISKLKERVK
jgi:spore maturation protein CgeB